MTFSRPRYFVPGPDGEPRVADLLEWARWFETQNHHLRVTEFGDVRISTVFLGSDHNFHGVGPPVLWETMIFGGKHDQYQERYSSRADALAGHDRAAALAMEE